MISCQLQIEAVSGEGCAPKILDTSRRISTRQDAEELMFPVEVGPARRKPDQLRRAGKEGGQKKADDGEGTVDAVEAPTRWVVARLAVATAAAKATEGSALVRGCDRCGKVPSPITSHTHAGSSMFALTYTINTSDDHLLFFIITASGTRFAASLVPPLFSLHATHFFPGSISPPHPSLRPSTSPLGLQWQV